MKRKYRDCHPTAENAKLEVDDMTAMLPELVIEKVSEEETVKSNEVV